MATQFHTAPEVLSRLNTHMTEARLLELAAAGYRL